MVVPTAKLPSGVDIPQLAYGTGTFWMKESDDIDRGIVEAFKKAIDLGYTHFDAAQYYRTEGELGLAIEESGVSRADLFITTKAVSPHGVEEALHESLRKLRTDYVDLYLQHEPFSSGSEEVLQTAWREMEGCLEKGLARSIGVSHFLIPHLKTIMKTAKVKPAVNQIEFHPYLQRRELRKYLREEDIPVAAFAALSSLTAAKGGPVDEVVERLAKKYDVSTSVVLLRWVLDQGMVVITTSSKEERLRDYLGNTWNFRLDESEIEDISAAGKRGDNYRGFFVAGFGADCWD